MEWNIFKPLPKGKSELNRSAQSCLNSVKRSRGNSLQSSPKCLQSSIKPAVNLSFCSVLHNPPIVKHHSCQNHPPHKKRPLCLILQNVFSEQCWKPKVKTHLINTHSFSGRDQSCSFQTGLINLKAQQLVGERSVWLCRELNNYHLVAHLNH